MYDSKPKTNFFNEETIRHISGGELIKRGNTYYERSITGKDSEINIITGRKEEKGNSILWGNSNPSKTPSEYDPSDSLPFVNHRSPNHPREKKPISHVNKKDTWFYKLVNSKIFEFYLGIFSLIGAGIGATMGFNLSLQLAHAEPLFSMAMAAIAGGVAGAIAGSIAGGIVGAIVAMYIGIVMGGSVVILLCLFFISVLSALYKFIVLAGIL